MRPKTLCVFDEIFVKGRSYCLMIGSLDDAELTREIETAARCFGNLGITLNKQELDFVKQKLAIYCESLKAPIEVADRFYDNVYNWNEFRNSFS